MTLRHIASAVTISLAMIPCCARRTHHDKLSADQFTTADVTGPEERIRRCDARRHVHDFGL
jgi:hypothetical protein